MVETPPTSAPYDADNLLDRRSRRATLELNYAHMMKRERALVDQNLGLDGGEVLSVGCGWHPGRHLFPAPAFRLVGADADPAKVQGVLETGRADEGVVGYAGRLGLRAAAVRRRALTDWCFHHLVFQGSLAPCFAEAARLLRPGGALIAIEPGLWHPGGRGPGPGQSHRPGRPRARHPDDVPLSPRRLAASASGGAGAARCLASPTRRRRLARAPAGPMAAGPASAISSGSRRLATP